MTTNAETHVPHPHNETVLTYAPGTPERVTLKSALRDMSAETVDVPLLIGGKEVRTGSVGQATQPHAHAKVLGKFHKASAKEVQAAIDAAISAQHDWSR